jgi:VanZ family protein
MIIMRYLFQVVAWILVVAIAGLSIVPPEYRVVTSFPQPLEHFSIFLLVGLAFCLGYPYRYMAQGVVLVLFAAAVELAQVWIPGRHARLRDFLAALLGIGVGVGLAYVSARLANRR